MRSKTLKNNLTPFRFISVSFLGAIMSGTLLLMLPVSSRLGSAAFQDALFTATSAVCVTGLVVVDTAQQWSYFGQGVILVLMELGGLGVVTCAAYASFLSGKKLPLMRLRSLQESLGLRDMGIMPMVIFAIKFSLIAELLGAALMSPAFVADFGARGLWMSLFHSVSAYCNAGFDVMGTLSPYSSMTHYAKSPLVNTALMALIITGGLGFMTWKDFCTHKLELKRYSLQSKIILSMTAALLLLPALFFYVREPLCGAWEAAFQSVTTRTAGFNTIDLSAMTEQGQTLMVMLMLVGAAPGSTGGGMKVTTVFVLFASASAVFRRRRTVQSFGRRIPSDTVAYASAIAVMYLFLMFASAFAISMLDGLPLGRCVFETVSAVCTVGLSSGVTAECGAVSRVFLIVLMFLGRVGGLTAIYSALSPMNVAGEPLYPEEKVTVG